MFIQYFTEVLQHKYLAEQGIKDRIDTVVCIHAVTVYKGEQRYTSTDSWH
jgi:hypothetical protein